MPDKGNNTLFIGTEGMLLTGFSSHKLYPEEKYGDFKRPEKSIPKSPGFYQEWVTACKGGPAATCNFEYSGPMAESVLLANVAYRTQSSFQWDHTKMASDNASANALLREDYHAGWEIK